MNEIKKVELDDINLLVNLIKKIYFILFCNKYPRDSFDKIFERVRRFMCNPVKLTTQSGLN